MKSSEFDVISQSCGNLEFYNANQCKAHLESDKVMIILCLWAQNEATSS